VEDQVVMKTISTNTITKQLNKCYMEFDPDWPDDMQYRVPAFKYFMEQIAGVKMEFKPVVIDGEVAYQIDTIEVVDEPKFTMWLLRWS